MYTSTLLVMSIIILIVKVYGVNGSPADFWPENENGLLSTNGCRSAIQSSAALL